MRADAFIVVAILVLMGCATPGVEPLDAATSGDASRADASGVDGAPGDVDASMLARSAGCGMAPVHALGGVQVVRAFSAAAGGERSFYLVVPEGYDASVAHRLVLGFAGTNWSGEMIRPYLDLESPGEREIYVYPDPLTRDFAGWGRLGGWLLGPHADPANGMDDIELVRELLDLIESSYCIDRERVFATGHSWGGDMAAVAGCFLGDRLRAVAPVAANRPYWFEPDGGGAPGCVERAAVWTFFGVADDHFTAQDHPGQYGEEQDAFWRVANECAGASTDLGIGASGECVEHQGCIEPVRLCLYGPETGHQVPGYFSAEVMRWLRAF